MYHVNITLTSQSSICYRSSHYTTPQVQVPVGPEIMTSYLFTLNHSFSVMAFSETWLKDDITGLYPFSQYNAFHSCRKNKAGGGVSIYLLDKYNCIQKRHS